MDLSKIRDLRLVVEDPDKQVPKRLCDPAISDISMAKMCINTLKSEEQLEAEGLTTYNHGLNKIDAIMYTNHFFGGQANEVNINGCMISHDRNLRATRVRSFYDIRAKSSSLRKYLPVAMQGPRMKYRREK